MSESVLIYAKQIEGGTGTFVKGLMTKVNSQNRLNFYLLLSEKPKYRAPFIPQCRYAYFSVKPNPEFYTISFTNMFRVFREIIWLRHHLLQFKPQKILLVDAHCLIVFWLSGYRKAKVCMTIHNNVRAVINYRIPKFLTGIIKSMIGLMLKQVHMVITVSNSLAGDLKQLFRLNELPMVINYGVEQYSFIIRQLPKTPIILASGRMTKQKDFVTVIRAYSIVCKKMPAAQLWIMGDGPDKSDLLAMVKNHNLNNVHFLGWQQDVNKIFSLATVYIHSANWEGFPFTLLEAMAANLPVIATNSPFGPSEILSRGQYGLLIPPGNSTVMAKSILKIISNNITYQLWQQRAWRGANQYSVSKMYNQYCALLTQKEYFPVGVY